MWRTPGSAPSKRKTGLRPLRAGRKHKRDQARRATNVATGTWPHSSALRRGAKNYFFFFGATIMII